MSYDFQTTTHGKWILAGEHAVLRGCGALVFPVNDKQLTLSHTNTSLELSADYAGDSGADMQVLFWSVLEQGMQLLGRSLNQIRGRFHLQCNIPVGVGMGASAALCVAMARWFAAQYWLLPTGIHDFAKELENLFHGQSSGLDIAGVAATTGVYFKQGICLPIKQAWSPAWRLSSCGQIGITSHCINQVQLLRQDNVVQADLIDKQMSDSVEQARAALEQCTPQSMPLLINAINNAGACFQQWGLVSDRLQRHMQDLRDEGALAVKPTGSGGGGYVVSLWKSPSQ